MNDVRLLLGWLRVWWHLVRSWTMQFGRFALTGAVDPTAHFWVREYVVETAETLWLSCNCGRRFFIRGGS